MINPSPHLPVQLRMAAAFLQQGQFPQAQNLLESYLKVQPKHLETLNALALLTMQTEQFEKAVQYLSKAISIKPKVAGLHSNLGNAYQKLGRLPEALDAYHKALKLDPRFAQAFYNRGHVFQALGQLDKALESFDQAIVIEPQYADAHNSRGIALQFLGNNKEAIVSYERAVSCQPNHAKAHCNLADLLSTLRQYDQALSHYDLALSHEPTYYKALINKGVLFEKINQLDQALECFDRVLQANTQSWEALSNRAITLQKMRRLEEAVDSLERAINISPGHASLYENLGNVLGELGLFNKALEVLDRAIEIDPTQISPLINQGIALHDKGELRLAIARFDQALILEPDNPEAHWNKAVCLLLDGQFDLGWQEFEWRWKRKSIENQGKYIDKPLWLGEASLQSRTILLHAEQGLGDTIQFCRYATAVAQLAARVILEVPAALVEVCRTLDGIHQVIQLGTSTSLEFDYHCPLMSLPLALKTKPTNHHSSLPYLKADPTKVALWKTKLGEKNKLRIGLVWSGGFRAEMPELWGVNARRNIPLELLAGSLKSFNAQFFSLQKGDLAEYELKILQNNAPDALTIVDLSNELNDFSDTAAVIENLDLIISVDTSTAHLASALGKPTWLLNRFDSCWRWLRTGKETAWYPTMKIYRQYAWQDWTMALKALEADLKKLTVS